MKKLFYTCPIKAAYMAKEFGVQFTHNFHFSVENYSGKNEVKSSWLKFCIAEESYPIFEPKEGDFGVSSLGVLQTFFDVEDGDGRWRDTRSFGTSGSIDNSRIIMRDDKVFFSPESEEA